MQGIDVWFMNLDRQGEVHDARRYEVNSSQFDSGVRGVRRICAIGMLFTIHCQYGFI